MYLSSFLPVKTYASTKNFANSLFHFFCSGSFSSVSGSFSSVSGSFSSVSGSFSSGF